MHSFVWIGVVLLALWAALWLVLNVVSGLVHLLVVAAAAMIIWGLVKRGASAVDDKL